MLKFLIDLIKTLLCFIGITTVSVFYICYFTNIPSDLFKYITIKTDIKKADVIVVLGAGSTKSGLPCKTSLERAIKGILLYKDGYSKKIIFSGGTNNKDIVPPAKAMANIAIKLGVKPSDIIVEDKSKTTYQNAIFTYSILKKENYNSVLLVTSESHIKRALELFKKLGVKTYTAYYDESLPSKDIGFKSKIFNFGILYKIIYENIALFDYKRKGWI